MVERDEAQVLLLMERLDQFPAQEAAPKGTQVPVPEKSRRGFAEQVYDKGCRVHVDEAVLVPLPGDQPGMGMWNFTRWVSRDEADAPVVQEPAPNVQAAVLSLLEKVNPELAEQVRNCPEDELPALRDQLGKLVPDALSQVQRINDEMAGDIRASQEPKKRTAKKAAPRKRTTPKKKAT